MQLLHASRLASLSGARRQENALASDRVDQGSGAAGQHAGLRRSVMHILRTPRHPISSSIASATGCVGCFARRPFAALPRPTKM